MSSSRQVVASVIGIAPAYLFQMGIAHAMTARTISKLGLFVSFVLAMIGEAGAQKPAAAPPVPAKTVDHAMFRAMQASINRRRRQEADRRRAAGKGGGGPNRPDCSRAKGDSCPYSP